MRTEGPWKRGVGAWIPPLGGYRGSIERVDIREAGMGPPVFQRGREDADDADLRIQVPWMRQRVRSTRAEIGRTSVPVVPRNRPRAAPIASRAQDRNHQG